MSFEQIIQHGTKSNWAENEPVEYWRERNAKKPTNRITCADGFTMSVIAGWGTYCTPRPDGWFDEEPRVGEDYEGPYTHVEVGFPSARPEPWIEWREWAEDPENPTGTVYAYVPVEAVSTLIESHGGEV
jgi:hypothetical protein